MREEELVGELRSLLSGVATRERWRSVCRVLERLVRTAPEQARETWIPYVERTLATWPTSMRQAPERWVEGLWSQRGVDMALWRLVREVMFHGTHTRHEWARVFEAPEMTWVERVVIHCAQFDDNDAKFLARMVQWPALRVLELPFNTLRLSGVRALAESERLCGLEGLSLERNAVTDDAGAILARKARFEGLRHLNLSSNKLGRDAATSLPSSVVLAQVERVDLEDNPLCEAAMWAHATHMTRLQELELGRTSLGAYGAIGLAEGPLAPGLVYLGLSHNNIDDRTVERFVQAPWFARLRHLDLSGNWLTDRGAHVLLDVANEGAMEVLELGGNDFSEEVRAHLEEHARFDVDV